MNFSVINAISLIASDSAEKNRSWIFDIFAWIGIIISILAVSIAVVWLTCFVVKILVKSFGEKVSASYSVVSEDIAKNTAAKKERNEKKRIQKHSQKLELLLMKLENKQKIHELKKGQLSDKLKEKELKARAKYLGETIEPVIEAESVAEPANEEVEVVEEVKKEPKKTKAKNKTEEKE